MFHKISIIQLFCIISRLSQLPRTIPQSSPGDGWTWLPPFLEFSLLHPSSSLSSPSPLHSSALPSPISLPPLSLRFPSLFPALDSFPLPIQLPLAAVPVPRGPLGVEGRGRRSGGFRSARGLLGSVVGQAALRLVTVRTQRRG